MSNSFTIIDGGMGTMLQTAGLAAGQDPLEWNLERPEVIAAIHRAYVEAGSSVVLSNTFGANPLKYHGKTPLDKSIAAALAIAHQAVGNQAKVALDLGPTGRMLKGVGDLDFDEAVAAFAETVRLAMDAPDRPELAFIETMGCLYELKAAVLAVRENSELPIFATVALQDDGRLLTGGSVEAFATLMESLGVEAYGFNCGLSPTAMLPHVKRLAKLSTRPIIVKPNAGVPHLEKGKTVFDLDANSFASAVAELAGAGAMIIGGCCGTTPAHIAAVRRVLQAKKVKPRLVNRATTVSSGVEAVTLSPHAGIIIGERINPTGKKALKEAYARGDVAYVLREAVKQTDAGAAILDVNCGVPGLDEAKLLVATSEAVQGVVACPIQLDTADPVALKHALRRVNGKALVNSVNGKAESMAAVFPIVRRYGGVMVALCLDEQGIPPTVEGRLSVARRILAEGASYGFTKADFVFDALTTAVSSDPQAAIVTLETVRRLTSELGVNTVLGVSNVSFGLPNRPSINNAMYALAKRAGLSAAIANPALIREECDDAAEAVLLARDEGCEAWIAKNVTAVEPLQVSAGKEVFDALKAAIGHGLKDDARMAAEQLFAAKVELMQIVSKGIVPALEMVGKAFETGKAYLPQLLRAADAAGEAFAVIKDKLNSQALRQSAGAPIVMATVKGDIHDIGKNIVRALLENFGFEVIDLGRDVPPERIVEAAAKNGAFLVGLSALMTTTVGAMAATVQLLRKQLPGVKTVVGGAVVTEEYAREIGADFYASDAMRTVRIAESCNRRVNCK